MSDTVPPPPTCWRDGFTENQYPRTLDRLRTLWRLATTDDQRHHIELLIGDVLDDAADGYV